jgi:hypothetical protein
MPLATERRMTLEEFLDSAAAIYSGVNLLAADMPAPLLVVEVFTFVSGAFG